MEAKTVRVQERAKIDSGQFHDLDLSTWEKMQETGRADFYVVVTPPTETEEVAELTAKHKKMSGAKKPESDNNGLQTTNAGLPDDYVGNVK